MREAGVWEVGQRVRAGAEKGFYWVTGVRPDGSVDVWGGDKDPSGSRKYRTIPARFVRADERKLERKHYPTEFK